MGDTYVHVKDMCNNEGSDRWPRLTRNTACVGAWNNKKGGDPKLLEAKSALFEYEEFETSPKVSCN